MIPLDANVEDDGAERRFVGEMLLVGSSQANGLVMRRESSHRSFRGIAPGFSWMKTWMCFGPCPVRVQRNLWPDLKLSTNGPTSQGTSLCAVTVVPISALLNIRHMASVRRNYDAKTHKYHPSLRVNPKKSEPNYRPRSLGTTKNHRHVPEHR